MIEAVPQIVFTPQLRRFLCVPDVRSSALTLRGALDDAFAQNPRLRGYVLDDQGHVRANVVIFIDGQCSHDRVMLCDPLGPKTRVHVLQALSGG